ncbi:MAG: T9SS type A sorting domain-containing protein [Chitinophagales bacterium]|nr:T9SS type A sorting domain-containing protein [Chitinophagales bacterium]
MIKSQTLKFLLSVLLFAFSNFITNAQVTITGGTTATGSYTKLSSAISSLNSSTITSAVTVSVNAGFTETLSGRINMTVTGTVVNTITIIKSGTGANPIVTAYTGGNATPASATPDGIFSIQGGDYITINGIDFKDNASNTTNPSTMEYGIGLFRNTTNDGCQNVTIQNCTITLNRINNAVGTAPMVDGSVGILTINSKPTAATTAVVPTSSGGSNSNNKFYTNTIQNGNIGIAIIGYADVSPFTVADANNDVGGSSTGNGNQILNFGGGGTTSAAAGVRTLAQYGLNVSYNTINSNNGSGVNHATTLRGIYINSAASANATINNNSVTVICGAATSAVSGIENASGSTAASNTISINNNTLSVQYPTATTGSTYGIFNNAASPATLNVSGNSFNLSSSVTSTGAVNCILNSGAVTTSITIDNNIINSVAFSAATSSTFKAIFNTAGSSAATMSISNNEFKGITYAVLSSGICDMIYTSPLLASETINSNNFNNITLNSGGECYLVYSGSSTPLATYNGNYISTQFTRSGTGIDYFYGILKTGSPSNGVITVSNNIFTNINLNSTSFGLTGISVFTSATSTQNIFSNTVSINNGTAAGAVVGISVTSGLVSNTYLNTITGLVSGASVYGIQTAGSTTPTSNIYNNKITGIAGNGGTNNCINVAGGVTINIYQNILYDCSNTNANASMNGVFINPISTPSTTNIYNNLIGKLNAPISTNGASTVNGIYVSGLLSGITAIVDYNTVYLNASSTGAEFSTSCINASSGPALTLRNNLLINLSTPKGAGKVVAYKRSSTSLTSYNNASDNNLFYAGTPSSANLIFFDGTNSKQTLSDYISFVTPRDANSKTENVNFLSTDVNSSDLLKINPAIGTVAESGAKVLSITTDYFGNTRNATTPDIGANEFSGFNDAAAPSFSFVPLSATCSTADVTLTAVTITDASGVPTTGSFVPRIYYKKNSGGYFSQAGVKTSGTGTNGTWNFTIVNSLMGGVTANDVISYYLIGQDIVGVPNTNIGSNPSGAIATDVNTVSSPPAPLSYSISGSTIFYADADVDGYGNAAVTTTGCVAPSGYVNDNTDCNDGNVIIHPGATEICNSIDDDCDNVIDEGLTQYIYYADADLDTYGNINASTTTCQLTAPTGYVINSTDCNDANAAVHPGVSDICNGIDDNCDNVIDENAITATVSPSGSVAICSGKSLLLTANSGAGINYQWLKNGANILGATTQTYSAKKAADYKVSETNSFGCAATSAVTTLVVNSLPVSTITPLGNLDICSTGSVVLQANSGTGLTYQWKKGSNNLAGETNQNYTATATGNYKVIVTNSNGCSKTSAGAVVTKSCKESIAIATENTSLNIYPNPAAHEFKIEFDLAENFSGPATIQIINMLGQNIFSIASIVNNGKLSININHILVDGNYLVRITTADKTVAAKLLIQH